MKIAIPSRSGTVDGHFGHCEYFTIFSVDHSGAISGENTFSAPAGCGCRSQVIPSLAGMGVTVMLAGNMGEGAARKLAMAGIDVVRGCTGNVRDVAESFLSGTLLTAEVPCDHNCSH